MSGWLRAASLIAIAFAWSCRESGPPAASAKHASAESCEYDVKFASVHPVVLEVEVRCLGEPHAFEACEPAAVAHVHEARTLAGRPLERENSRWLLRHGESGLRYRLDLGALAEQADDFDVAAAVGDSIVAPASSWLLRPAPARPAVPLYVRVHSTPAERFATGLRRLGPQAWEIDAHELHVATYSVFGSFLLDRMSLSGQAGDTSEIELVTLDGALDAKSSSFASWFYEAARAVAKFWGGFPVRHVLVVLVPVPHRSGILFGKVLPESAPGIVIVVGQHTDPAVLKRDWIVVHELFHLGFPSFQDEGKWLDEGLATYYEPLIRARAGWLSEAEVWNEFMRAMPQGLAAVERDGLENARDFRGIYWGGAIMALLADVEARKKSSGQRGLEDGLRALLSRGAHSSEVWDLDRAISVIDHTLDAPVLRSLTHRHAARGKAVALDELFAALGVRRVQRGVVLDDSAPLSALRHALVYGGPRASK